MSALVPIIFDVEGTLIDCVGLTILAWQAVLKEYGHLFSYAELHKYSGMDGKLMLAALLPGTPRATIEQLVKAQGDHYRAQYLEAAAPIDGVRALFADLHRAHRLALATSCDHKELATYLDRLAIGAYLDAVVCGEDASAGKPAPDLIAIAKAKLGLAADETALMVGDTPYDAQAALRAGAIPLGVETGGFARDALLAAGCREVAPNVAALRCVLGGSAGAAST